MGPTPHAAATGRQRQYLVIDLKSFYASVECVERDLDPMTTDLVVADASRTSKTICLAVSPSLKARGVRNRCRLFEIPESFEYIVAPPRMALYMERSADIYSIYLRYVSPDDIHVYSIDEAFLDVTGYLDLYGCTARELGERIREEVVRTTGIPATCGLGTNLYLAKVALDITAKHSPDFFGVLDEQLYRDTLWTHRPITDFWRVGPGTARRLDGLGIHTMGQLATYPQDPIYQVFGVDAEILIDHAWGREPVTIADIKSYRTHDKSISSGQVLGCDRDFEGGLVIAKEMADDLALQLVERGLVAESVSLAVGYRATGEEGAALARPEGAPDGEGRVGEHGVRGRWGELTEGGTARLPSPTSSRARIVPVAADLYRRVADRGRPIHRLTMTLGGVVPEGSGEQMGLFDDPEALARERRRQEAISAVKRKFGRNSLLKGIDLLPEATQRERNGQIGGHRSGVE